MRRRSRKSRLTWDEARAPEGIRLPKSSRQSCGLKTLRPQWSLPDVGVFSREKPPARARKDNRPLQHDRGLTVLQCHLSAHHRTQTGIFSINPTLHIVPASA
jgi:hypothetical protein